MDLKTLAQTEPFEWPRDSDETILEALRNGRGDAHDRLFAVEIAGCAIGVNDELADTLLSILGDPNEAAALRVQAAASLGPTLEYADEQGFWEFSDATISEGGFEKIRRSLHTCYGDAGNPKEVRRRALEASVRSPQEWHRKAIRSLYASEDEDWKLTAVFCMKWVGGFEAEIVEALGSDNRSIQCEALSAFGDLGFDVTGPDFAEAIDAEDVKTGLVQAVISHINGLPPQEAEMLLNRIATAGDDEITEAVGEDVASLDANIHPSAALLKPTNPGTGSDLMDIEEILQHLEYNKGHFPRVALEAAIARQKEIIPELLGILERAERDAQDLLEQNSGYMGHIYSMYLLAQFREVRAYPLLARFFSLPGEISVDLTGDLVTEDLGRLLASVSGGDTTLMEGLVENEQVNEWVRGAALGGLLTLVSSGERSREDVIDYFGQLFRGRLVRQPGQVWDSLVECSTVLCPEGVYADIEQAYAHGLVDLAYVSWAKVGDSLRLGKKQMLAELRRDPHRQLVSDTIAEMEWWACFDQGRRPKFAHDTDLLTDLASPSLFGQQEPIRRTGPKVGRNDLCPCGSGKKYKKCCGGH